MVLIRLSRIFLMSISINWPIVFLLILFYLFALILFTFYCSYFYTFRICFMHTNDLHIKLVTWRAIYIDILHLYYLWLLFVVCTDTNTTSIMIWTFLSVLFLVPLQFPKFYFTPITLYFNCNFSIFDNFILIVL